ncbi:choice-of-anchor J domain-containing protein [bacterium AH-315-C07]|nr:choice-of-anchor J domain-containing protein [bacterium AH-315-C07]
MKKLLFFLVLFSSLSIHAQILYKNFEDSSVTSYGWTTYNVSGTQYWYLDEFSGNKFAKMSGYESGSNYVNEDWLISSPIHTQKHTSAILSFLTAKNYTGNDLEVLISSDYSGSGDPNLATWTNLNPTLSAGSWTWTNSGNIDLSAYLGQTLYIGFKYTSDATNSATWEVDDYLVTLGSYPHYYVSEIRNVDANGVEKKVELVCEVSGIIHGINDQLDDGYLSIHLMDVTGGLKLFKYTLGSYSSLTEGDSVIARGRVIQYNGWLELYVDTVITVSTGNPVNYPLKVTELNERTEGEVVYLQNVFVTNITDYTGFKLVDLSDGTNTYWCKIDNLNTAFYNMNLPASTFNLTGISTQYDESSPYLSGYQILPTQIDSLQPACGDTLFISVFDTTLVLDTNLVTINDTNVVTINDTIAICDSATVTITDTVIVNQTVFDTTFVSVYDTTIVIVYDTTNVIDTTSIDTSFVTVYDTTFVIDTNLVIVNDTIAICDSAIVTITDTVTIYKSISVTDTLIIDVTFTGISPPDNTNTIKVFPNPAVDAIIIDMGNYTMMTDHTIKILNTLGQEVFSSLVNIPQFKIDISILGSTGVYYLQILDAGNNIIDTRKLILK